MPHSAPTTSSCRMTRNISNDENASPWSIGRWQKTRHANTARSSRSTRPDMLHGRYCLVLSGHGGHQTLCVAIGPRAVLNFVKLTLSTVAEHVPRYKVVPEYGM